MCARELGGGGGIPDFRDGRDNRRIFWDLKFSISIFSDRKILASIFLREGSLI